MAFQVGHNTATLTGAYWSIDDLQTTSATGSQNNFVVDVISHTITATGSAPIFTGLTNGRAGREINIQNTGTGTVTLTHEGAGSTAANRIDCPDNISLTENQRAHLIYSGTRWLAVKVSQTASVVNDANTILATQVFS